MARYIDADAYKKYLDEHWIPANYDAIDEQPTADVVPVVHAHWIRRKCEWGYLGRNCSTCGYLDLLEKEIIVQTVVQRWTRGWKNE